MEVINFVGFDSSPVKDSSPKETHQRKNISHTDSGVSNVRPLTSFKTTSNNADDGMTYDVLFKLCPDFKSDIIVRINDRQNIANSTEEFSTLHIVPASSVIILQEEVKFKINGHNGEHLWVAVPNCHYQMFGNDYWQTYYFPNLSGIAHNHIVGIKNRAQFVSYVSQEIKNGRGARALLQNFVLDLAARNLNIVSFF